MVSLRAGVAAMRQKFRDAGLDSPDLDARVLAEGVLGLTPEKIIIDGDRSLTQDEEMRLQQATHRRLQREPVSRILQSRSFWKADFKVTPDTLDPRADSETLVEAVLAHVDHQSSVRILDLGTGTGCLLLSILHDLPHATGVGVDISQGAIDVARDNAVSLGLAARAQFERADWAGFTPDAPFDVVISNPPYIPDDDIAGLDPEVRDYDPLGALAGGADGLDCYRTITGLLPHLLAPAGKVFFEVGAGQAPDVKGILAVAGYPVVQIRPDLAGHERCVVAHHGKASVTG